MAEIHDFKVVFVHPLRNSLVHCMVLKTLMQLEEHSLMKWEPWTKICIPTKHFSQLPWWKATKMTTSLREVFVTSKEILWNVSSMEYAYLNLPYPLKPPLLWFLLWLNPKNVQLSSYGGLEAVRSHSSLKCMLRIAEVSKVGMKLSGKNMLSHWLDFTCQFIWDSTQSLGSFYVYMHRETGRQRES